MIFSLVYMYFQCSFLLNALNVPPINRGNWKVFKNHVLATVVLVQSFQIINKTSQERDYTLHYFSLAPSEQCNKNIMVNLCNQVTHNCGNCLCVCLCLTELTLFFLFSCFISHDRTGKLLLCNKSTSDFTLQLLVDGAVP